jgi:DNA-binding transcriptional regulator YhcF (GntR family)
MPAAPRKQPATQIRQIERKWGKPLKDAGFVIIPSVLLEYQARLKIDPIDLTLLLQIAKHWWDPDKPPFPSRKLLGECIGRDVSTVQRRLSKLRDRGLIEIEHRHDAETHAQTSSIYTFKGLIEKATVLANEKLAAREERKRQETAARRRPPRFASGADLKIAVTDR